MFEFISLHVKKNQGFSLIELVVVLTIFLIVVAVSTDIFISVVDSQRRILQEQEILNQTSFVMERISSGLKLAQKDINGNCLGDAGKLYVLTHCPNGILEPCNGVKFINQLDNNSCDEIFLDVPGGSVLKETKNGVTTNLISQKFIIKSASFIINGDKSIHSAAFDDLVRPKVTVFLDIATDSAQNPQEKLIQTTVSKRYGDLSSSSSSSSCLAGYWKLDEDPTTSGATILDSSGNNLSATPQGPLNANNLPQPNSDVPVGFPPGSRSLEFDGSDDRVDFGNSPLINPTQAISVAFWIKTDSLIYGSFGNDAWHVYIRNWVQHEIEWITYDGSNNFNALEAYISTDVGGWHQVTVVWQPGTDQKKIYLDGVQVAVGSHSVVLGSDNSGVDLKFFDIHPGDNLENALVDDIRIYGCALTASQVGDLQVPGGPVGGIDSRN